MKNCSAKMPTQTIKHAKQIILPTNMKREETEKCKAIKQISKSQKKISSQMKGHDIAKQCTEYKTNLEKISKHFSRIEKRG